MSRVLMSVLFMSAGVSLAACEGTKEELGLTRRTPDEFAVVQRAPLEMPPDYYLRPPAPGAPRPQEPSIEAQAETAVLGTARVAKGTSKSENVLLQKTNATAADPNIRSVINAETAAIAADDKSTVQRILNIGGSDKTGKIDGPAPVVDPVAEAKRLQANKAAGKPVTDGVTPTIKK